MQEHDGGSAGKTISPVAFLWASAAPMLPSQQGLLRRLRRSGPVRDADGLAHAGPSYAIILRDRGEARTTHQGCAPTLAPTKMLSSADTPRR
jgi:hypothetical protein